MRTKLMIPIVLAAACAGCHHDDIAIGPEDGKKPDIAQGLIEGHQPTGAEMAKGAGEKK